MKNKSKSQWWKKSETKRTKENTYFLDWCLELKDVAWGRFATRLSESSLDKYWRGFYEGGYTPAGALKEDMSYDAGK